MTSASSSSSSSTSYSTSSSTSSSSRGGPLPPQQQQLQQQLQQQPQQSLPPPPPQQNKLQKLPPQQPQQLLQQQQQQPQGHQPPQQFQQPGDFDSASSSTSTAGARQSQRYSLHNLLNISQTSLHDQPGHHQNQPQQQQQPPAAGQSAATSKKRSAQKIIKGLFSGRGHDSHRDQQNPSSSASYDNTVGLARRPSKRVSTLGQQHQPPPNLKTGLSAVSDRDWHSHTHTPSSSVHQTSPLQGVGEAEEYYAADHQYHDLQHQQQQQPDLRVDPRHSVPPINTARGIGALDDISSPYDDAVYHAPPPSALHHPSPSLSQHQNSPSQLQPQPQPHVLASQESLQPQHHQQQLQQQQQQQQLRYDPQQQHQQQAAYDQQLPPPPASSQQYYSNANSPQDQYQQTTDPRIVTTHLVTGSQQQQNPETVSQLSRESPAPDSDQRSLNQQPSPAIHYSVPQAHDQSSNVALPPSQPANQQQLSQPAMAPPGGGGVPTNRRPADAEKALPGAPPGYRHTHTNSNNLNAPGASLQPGQQPASSTSGAAVASGAAAGAGAAAAGAPPRYEAATGDQGRNSPQPSTHERDSTESDKAFKELLTKYKNVKRLYFDGKSQIEQLNGQVEHLQNAVANQRMSQSRTALDDNEYVNRFNRLNGAINNLAFNIRKDWRRLPLWLENYVSPDALKTGKQEMTAVGRAVITKWIVDEVFNKCFHPDLDAALSSQLKEIELNIRGNAYTMHSQEEFDALTTKVVNWRMATLDGLQQKLSSSAAADNRASLITKTQTNLTAHLYQFLIEPPPAGVDGSTSMIMELAVGIAANMPRESRDVTIQYPLPGDVLQAGVMDVEKTPLPPLDGQKEGESSKPDSDADKDKSSSSGDSSKAGFAKDASRVRFAGFVALEVRGRQVLVKAPVWAM
ncbi:uncharacterized protein TrAtP1_010069 [Trichoderma atroviride]|uniref:uncharacterized protein n=1 Tax=Hypocrea atroviridis TaxID=63577 RepID=UPI0033330A12|nr:hypothetical protein TrAtP1_010069 [Trichoderma atroviride]